MTGQEERDVLFARLFGLTAVIQSGLLVRLAPLPSASSISIPSSLAGYKEVLSQLIALGEKKSFLRESAWWTMGLAIDALNSSEVAWKKEAVNFTVQSVLVDHNVWTPEKVAITLKFQSAHPKRDWSILSPTFKNTVLLSSVNLQILARILKVSLSSFYLYLTITWLHRNPTLRTRTGIDHLLVIGNLKYTLSGT